MEGQDLDDAADLPGKMLYWSRGCIEMGGCGDFPETEADGRELEGSAFQEGRGGLQEVAGDFRRNGEVCGGLIFLAEGKMEFGRIVPGGAGTALFRSIRTRTSLHSLSEERIWTSAASGSSESRTRMSAMGEAFSRMQGAMRSSSGRRAVMSGSQSLRE